MIQEEHGVQWPWEDAKPSVNRKMLMRENCRRRKPIARISEMTKWILILPLPRLLPLNEAQRRDSVPATDIRGGGRCELWDFCYRGMEDDDEDY